MRFPADGFPEVLTARIGGAFYRLARQGDVVVIAGGEQGGITGYDLAAQFALTFPGSTSARLNGLAPVPGAPGRFLVLRNNAPGLALLDFNAAAPRVAETRAIDLGAPAQLGAVRIDRLRDLAENAVAVEIRTSNGSDELEGWSPWASLAAAGDGWRGPPLRGRYVKLRIHSCPPRPPRAPSSTGPRFFSARRTAAPNCRNFIFFRRTIRSFRPRTPRRPWSPPSDNFSRPRRRTSARAPSS